MKIDDPKTMAYHLGEVREGRRRFESSFESVARMILEDSNMIEKVTINGKSTYDFKVFRTGPKHVIGMFDEINSFVSFVKDAAEGGSSQEMAFVLVGEPGNGKTFFVDSVCALYRQFIAREGNRRYTFNYRNIERLENYGKIRVIQSQTFEDPLVLAMNLFPSRKESMDYLASTYGFTDRELEKFNAAFRPLGACSDYILGDIRNATNGNIEEILDFIEVVPVPLSESLGTITGKYSAKDKITSSAVDLLGEESIQRLLHLTDPNNPYRFDLRRGALARVAGGGIHFSAEIFKNKKDLVQVYL
ncbi:MAG: hypothetical protein PHN75_13640, partial [Syntrophales bacterium]|nr:hypothetical protein [Syntrophales bacterium]